MPFTKPFDRRERVQLDPDARIPPHTPLPPTLPPPDLDDLPSSLMPRSAPSVPPPAPQREPWSASALVLTALLLVTALATVGAWLVWS